ncbi:MAG: hypothetical protein NT175_13145 [Bacteroidetes bacterium]|nr:hypothetical protein [Bacteroidota bacterium]
MGPPAITILPVPMVIMSRIQSQCLRVLTLFAATSLVTVNRFQTICNCRTDNCFAIIQVCPGKGDAMSATGLCIRAGLDVASIVVTNDLSPLFLFIPKHPKRSGQKVKKFSTK